MEVKVFKLEGNNIGEVLDKIFTEVMGCKCKAEEEKIPEKDPRTVEDALIYVESLERLGKKLGMKHPYVITRFLDKISEASEVAAFSMILKEIAITLDKKYEDHISKSDEIYVISTIDGKIMKVKEIRKIKSFKNFAAFRTLEDARTACRILKSMLKDMFSGKQKD